MSEKYLTLKLENKPVWPDSETLIVNSFVLISQKKSAERFKEYLASPFFVKDGEQMTSLFSYLYPKLSSEEHTEIRLTDILWKVYKSRDLKAHGRGLRKLIKATHREIFRFNAYFLLEEQPEEMARLRTLSLRNKGLSEHYREEQKEWERQAEKLPSGTNGALHRWAARDAGYIGLDIPKSKFDAEAFKKIWKSLGSFFRLQQNLYELEVAHRPKLRGQLDSFIEDAVQNGRNAVLTNIYTKLASLLSDGEAKPGKYKEIKRLFLRHGKSFDVEHQLAVMIGLINYLQDLHAKGNLSLQPEMSFWPQMMLKSMSHKRIPVIPKRLFNNQVHLALINDEMWLAERLKKELYPQLPVSKKNYVREHIELAFAFYGGRHEEVINRAQALSVARFHIDNHDEVMRLKSYQLRSLLVCLSKNPANYYYRQNLKNRLKALDKYLDKYSKLDLFNHGDNLDRYRRFRSAVRYTFDYLKRSFDKPTAADKVIRYIEEDEPMACRQWFRDFVAEIS